VGGRNATSEKRSQSRERVWQRSQSRTRSEVSRRGRHDRYFRPHHYLPEPLTWL